MKVKAKVMGQYKGRIYEPGMTFEVEQNEILAWWMEPVVVEKVEVKPKVEVKK